MAPALRRRIALDARRWNNLAGNHSSDCNKGDRIAEQVRHSATETHTNQRSVNLGACNAIEHHQCSPRFRQVPGDPDNERHAEVDELQPVLRRWYLPARFQEQKQRSKSDACMAIGRTGPEPSMGYYAVMVRTPVGLRL